jgi:hypothetical protein
MMQRETSDADSGDRGLDVMALLEISYFSMCRALGSVLRSARYSSTRIAQTGRAPLLRKQRLFYAPLLIWLSRALVRLLDTGVWVLPQREWQERERELYWSLRGTPVQIDDGVLVLPVLHGQTLGALLANPALDESMQRGAITLATVALAELHRLGFTHGDAMAENVMVDLDADIARWFDFETIHDPHRPMVWRRADDVRALLMTCLAHTSAQRSAETARLILGTYADRDVAGVLADSLASAWRRPLAFHLGQAGLSFRCYREIGRFLNQHRPRPSRRLLAELA